MKTQVISTTQRLPRFRRAAEPPAFQLTDGDVQIVRLLARHRFLRSTHIAALVGRSLDRTNDRLKGLFHHGYLDRPRSQLDYYPVGSAPMVYALADRGARLLIERDGVDFANVEWSRKNRAAGRPFVDHQLEIMDFYVALQCAMHDRADVRLIHPDELVAEFPDQSFNPSSPFALRARISHKGMRQEIAVIPDLAFGLRYPDDSRRCYMVEIDRGTMPVTRSDFDQTSFARKMRGYLAAHAARQHERQFGWKTFRVLTVTTHESRQEAMLKVLRPLCVPHSPGPGLFAFSIRQQSLSTDPTSLLWCDGLGRELRLI